MQLVDAGMIAFAGWHALEGRVDWPLTFQVPRMLRSTLRDAGDGGDTYVLCWNAGRLRKRELWPDYRDRPEIWDEAGEEDFRLMLRVLSALGVVQYRADGWEADEVLAALVHRLEGEAGQGAAGEADRERGPDSEGGRGERGGRDREAGSEPGGEADAGREELVIRSDDKDFMQLLSDTVRMEGRRRGTVRASDVEGELGVPPVHVADLLALAGDRADGIPRIVPPSTARELIEAYGHVRDWIDRIDRIRRAAGGAGGPGAVDEELAATLEGKRDQLRLNVKLVDLSADAVGAPPEPMLEGWGDLGAAREVGERTGIGWLTDDDLADEYALLREWGQRTRERLGV